MCFELAEVHIHKLAQYRRYNYRTQVTFRRGKTAVGIDRDDHALCSVSYRRMGLFHLSGNKNLSISNLF